MKKWIRNNYKILIVFVIYIIITFTLIFFHENWRDEAQAWLLARDCNLVELFNNMKYEGHFLLWYLLLMPFAKLGFPYITINIVSWFITCITAWLILKNAPCNLLKKILLIFTTPMLYLYSVLARCYCLIPLAIVLMCIFYKDRKEKPFRYLLSVVLLANTHVIMTAMVGIVLLDFIVENIKEWKSRTKLENKRITISLVFTLLLLLITMLPLFGCLTTNKDIGNNTSIIIKILNTIFLYPFYLFSLLEIKFIKSIFLCSIIVLVAIVILLLEIKQNPKIYIRVLICILYQCTIYAFIFGPSHQRIASIIFIFLYYKWICTYKNNKKTKNFEKNILTYGWIYLILINNINGLSYINYEIQNNYSNAYQVGNFIKMNLDENSVMISGPRIEMASSIIPYVNNNIKFYCATQRKYFTYSIWDEYNNLELKDEDIEELKATFNKNQKLYYIYCPNKYNIVKIDATRKETELIEKYINNGIFKEVFSTDTNSYELENYIIYEIDFSTY